MALSRAFTSRRKPFRLAFEESPINPLPSRSATQRLPASKLRNKISGPVELLSTTNMLSYNAPDIFASPSPTNSSDDDSEAPSQIFSARASNTSSTDSIPLSPAPNHLTAFFSPPKPGDAIVKPAVADPPAVPKRANSHTTALHQTLARQRSHSRTRETAPPTAIDNVVSHSRISGSSALCSPAIDNPAHPFSRELQQVNELAEEMGLDGSMLDEEDKILRSKGLCKFTADDYLTEILGLYGDVFRGEYTALDPSWI